MMTDDEWFRWIREELGPLAIQPHVERLRRIALDRDVAIVFYEPDTDALPREFLALLRGSHGGDVVQLTRTRAMRIFGRARHPIATWILTRSPEGGSKILICTGRFLLPLNVASSGRLSLDPATYDEA